MTALLILNLILSLFLLGLYGAYYGFLKNLTRNHGREAAAFRQRESELIDRLMHVTGNTWVLPPRENLTDEEVEITEETHPELFGWKEA